MQSCPSRRVWVFHPKGTRHNPEYFNLTTHSGRSSIKLHGYVSGECDIGVLTLIRGNLNSEKYCDILSEIFPVINDEFPENDFVFMHDRHPAHTSKKPGNFFKMNIRKLRTVCWIGHLKGRI